MVMRMMLITKIIIEELNMRERTRRPSHPGGVLKRLYLDPLKITNARLAEIIGVSRKRVSKIVNEKGSITPDMALRLSRAFSTTPELWINLQRNHDLWQARNASRDWLEVQALAKERPDRATA
jgi:antitoxin HigA-1